MNIYYMINWFFLCSLLGYLLECVVLTWENHTPVLNRGFGHGPFCIIYGFGALGARTYGETVFCSHDYGYPYGTGDGQGHDPAVWKLLVGLQQEEI